MSFTDYSNSPDPAVHVESVTPSDSTDLTDPSRALWVGTGGNVAVVMIDGSSAILVNVPDGGMLPLRVTRVNATGTTASNIVSLS